MSEPKFTPGPWALESRRDICDEFECWLHPINLHIHDKISDADAHLIAAAPDLYRELEMARFTIAMEIATMGPRTLDKEEKEALVAEHPAIKSIDVALSKARGEG